MRNKYISTREIILYLNFNDENKRRSNFKVNKYKENKNYQTF